jgi:PAS domain S-box-containing protein
MRSIFTSGLRGRLVLILLAAFAAVAGLIVWQSIGHRDLLLKIESDHLLDEARIVALRQQALIDRAEAILNSLMPTQEARRMMGAECQRNLAARLQAAPDFFQLGTVLPNGDVSCTAVQGNRGVNVADRLWFRQAQGSQAMIISPALIDRTSGKPAITLGKALRDDAGNVQAVFYLSLSLDWLKQALTKSSLPDQARLLVVDRQGEFVVSHPEPKKWTGTNVADHPSGSLVRSVGSEGVVEGMGEDNVPRLIAFTPLLKMASGDHYSLWLTLTKDQIEAPARQQLRTSLILAMMILLVVLAAVYWGGNRYLVKRLQILSGTAGRLGTGDFSARSGLQRSSDEIGELDVAVQKMAETLEESTVSRRRLQDEIDEHRLAQHRLRESQITLRQVARIAGLGAWSMELEDPTKTDLARIKVGWSPEMYQLLGYTLEDLPTPTAKAFFARVHPDDRAAVLDNLTMALAGKRSWRIEYRLLLKDGRERLVAESGECYFDEEGRLNGVYGALMDITEQKCAENQLRKQAKALAEAKTAAEQAKGEAEKANSAKSRFLAAASHDLRQPLSALTLYVDVLARKLGGKDDSLVRNVQDCVANLRELLTDLLDISKLEAGVVTPTISDFPINRLLTSVLSVHLPMAGLKNLQLRCVPSRLTVRSDIVLFQRMLGNLLANAIRYTERGRVLVGCRRRQGRVWVEVWDTGIGIPEHKTGEIFEEFKQLGDGARTRGSGLGLAIVAKTAALLGVEVRVRSWLGRGSMFALELPLGVAVAPAVSHPPEQPSLHIALVEDNTAVRQALTCALESAGHRVLAAESRVALHAQLGRECPAIVLTDYRLTDGETGIDVIDMVREVYGCEVPALVMTGETDPNFMRSMANRGIAVQHKPIHLDALQACLISLVARPSDEPALP